MNACMHLLEHPTGDLLHMQYVYRGQPSHASVLYCTLRWVSNVGTGVCKQGTVKRWEQVSAYVRTRAVDEVLDMVKHGLKAGRFAPKQDSYSVAKKRQVSSGKHSPQLLLPVLQADNCSISTAAQTKERFLLVAVWVLKAVLHNVLLCEAG